VCVCVFVREREKVRECVTDREWKILMRLWQYESKWGKLWDTKIECVRQREDWQSQNECESMSAGVCVNDCVCVCVWNYTWERAWVLVKICARVTTWKVATREQKCHGGSVREIVFARMWENRLRVCKRIWEMESVADSDLKWHS